MDMVTLASITRLRGDARMQIQGLDFGAPGRRLCLSIQQPRDVEDEVEGVDNWLERGRFALRLMELDELIRELQRARGFLIEPR